jgi:hypothetical protein
MHKRLLPRTGASGSPGIERRYALRVEFGKDRRRMLDDRRHRLDALNPVSALL